MFTENPSLEPVPQSLGAKVSTPTMREKIATRFQNIKNALSDTLELSEADEHAQYGIGSAGPGVADRINKQKKKAVQEAKDTKWYMIISKSWSRTSDK